MTPAQLTTLANEVNGDPLSLGYAALKTNSPGQIVLLLNALNYTAPVSTKIGISNIIQVFGIAASPGVLNAISTALPTTIDYWSYQCLVEDAFDVSLAWVATWLGSLVTALKITQAQHDALLALANVPASRATVLGLPSVQEADLRAAGV